MKNGLLQKKNGKMGVTTYFEKLRTLNKIVKVG